MRRTLRQDWPQRGAPNANPVPCSTPNANRVPSATFTWGSAPTRHAERKSRSKRHIYVEICSHAPHRTQIAFHAARRTRIPFHAADSSPELAPEGRAERESRSMRRTLRRNWPPIDSSNANRVPCSTPNANRVPCAGLFAKIGPRGTRRTQIAFHAPPFRGGETHRTRIPFHAAPHGEGARRFPDEPLRQRVCARLAMRRSWPARSRSARPRSPCGRRP